MPIKRGDPKNLANVRSNAITTTFASIIRNR
jgi:hypothetical protein